MDPRAFLSLAERGAPPPLALLHGADPQLLDDAVAVLGRALLSEPSAAAFDRDVFDAREASVEQIVNAALTLPVLAPRRLVVVRHAQALPARARDALAQYASAPNPSACLLLIADESLGPTRDRRAHWLLDALPAEAVVEASPRRGRALEEWLRQRAQAEGLTVSEEASRLLVQWIGEDTTALLGEARKAALAGGPENRTVGVREVTAVVGEHRVSAVFELARAVERREVGLALRTLDRLLATEDAMPLLALLTRLVRQLWSIKAWREQGRSPEQVAAMLRLRPPAADVLLAAAGQESGASLAWKLFRCWQAEWRLKSGGEPRAEMAALVTELCRGGAR